MDRRSVNEKVYDEEYFLSSCNGYEIYQETRGRVLNRRMQLSLMIANLKREQSILDVGCGRGELAFHCALQGCKVLGIDYSPSAIKIASDTVLQLPVDLQKNVELKQIDAKEMVFRNEFFDIIFMIDVIEHLYDWELKKVIEKCRSYLKKGGKLVVHTYPTRNYIKYGHTVNRIIKLLTDMENIGGRDKFFKFDLEKGHVNIQTKESLEKLLLNFNNVDVWYEFLDNKSLTKRLLKKSPLANILASELFAVAYKV